MLSRAKSYPIFDGRLSIRVIEPEDLIGFKVQAIANNPKRCKQEEADIERLAELYRGRLDWHRIQEYDELFEMGDEAQALRQRVEHAQ